jgi:putative hydrolase of the HAD superfamily
MIKLVLFDLDDTLYQEKQFVMSAFKSISKYLSKKYNIKYDKIFKILKDDFNKGLRKKNFNVLIKKLQLIDEDVDYLVRIYRNHKPEISLYNDAEYILNKLKKTIKLGLVTDGYIATQQNKISSLKIKNYFDVIIINSPKDNIDKKNPKIFNKIIKKLKVNPKDTVYVGDNPLKDFIASKKIGIHTVRIKRKSGEYSKFKVEGSIDADFVISNLNELTNIINNIK